MVRYLLSLILLVPLAVQAGPEQRGQTLFNLHCAACHGRNADGQGPMVAVLKQRPPNLTELARNNAGSFPIEAVAAQIDGRQQLVAHGGPMPVYGWFFEQPSDRDTGHQSGVPAAILDIVRWLETVQR